MTTYTCLGCGKPGYPSCCPECVNWDDPADGVPGVDQNDTTAPADPDPAPGRRTLVPAIRTTARAILRWTAEDRACDARARAWSRRLLDEADATAGKIEGIKKARS